jgi:hypothetical protein
VERFFDLWKVEIGCPEIFMRQALGDFLPEDYNIRGRIDAQANLTTPDLQDHHPDIISNHDTFTDLAGKYEHDSNPFAMRASRS